MNGSRCGTASAGSVAGPRWKARGHSGSTSVVSDVTHAMLLPSQRVLSTEGASFNGHQIGHLDSAGPPAFVKSIGQAEDHRAALLSVQWLQ